jgi:DNA polymerase-3 subunit delta'
MAELDGAMTSLADSGDSNNKLRTGLAKSLSSKASQPRYEAFLDRVPGFIAKQAEAREGASLHAALDAYDTARALAASARALSLDQQATVYEMAGIVARLAVR